MLLQSTVFINTIHFVDESLTLPDIMRK